MAEGGAVGVQMVVISCEGGGVAVVAITLFTLGLFSMAPGGSVCLQMAVIAWSARNIISSHGTSQLPGSGWIGCGGTNGTKGQVTPSCDCVS